MKKSIRNLFVVFGLCGFLAGCVDEPSIQVRVSGEIDDNFNVKQVLLIENIGDESIRVDKVVINKGHCRVYPFTSDKSVLGAMKSGLIKPYGTLDVPSESCNIIDVEVIIDGTSWEYKFEG